MGQQPAQELLKASIPYVTALASYFWRLTSAAKTHTLIRYAFLLAFAYGALLGAYFVARWWLVVVTMVVLLLGLVFLKPTEAKDDQSAEVR